jgi:hypothetical protein
LATQTSSSNTRLVAIGGVVLLVGVILVLLILRGTVGGDDPVPSEPATNSDTEPTTEQTAPRETELVPADEATTARVDLPLEVADGHEAVSVRASYERGVAALPASGDRVVVYALAAAADDEDEDDATGPAPDGDAQRVLADVEVLGVIGPRPAANDGTLTFVLAVPQDEVGSLLPVARDRDLWLTLLPGEGVEAGDADEDAEA